MSLLIPDIFKNDSFKKADLEKLWLHPQNINYNKAQIVYAVKTIAPHSNINCLLNANKHMLGFINSYMHDPQTLENNRLSYLVNKTVNVDNSLLNLHNANKAFILDVATEIINNPNILDPNFGYEIGTRKVVKLPEKNKTIDEAVFIDGHYAPENLFLNKRSTYWRPLEVKFNPWERSPGNKYTGSFIDSQTGKPNVQNYNLYEVVQRHYAPLDHNYLEEKTEIPKRLGY